MTIAAQVKQTLPSLKGIEATLESFKLLESSNQTNDILDLNIQRIQKVIRDFEDRLGVLEFEEPQYKGL
ncbi:MAG: DUF1657 domain-containing protein [Peptococcaceae bacterium]|nr:DUF1657 domain-containing protein [Peptococcaceae bacterium]